MVTRNGSVGSVPEGRLTIAQHFSAGKTAKTERFLVPEGRLKGNFEGRLSIVPPGQIDFHRSTDPAMNRWAIVNGPSGAGRIRFSVVFLALFALLLPAVSRADGRNIRPSSHRRSSRSMRPIGSSPTIRRMSAPRSNGGAPLRRRQAGPRSGHLPRGPRRLSRRGLVLARFHRPGQSCAEGRYLIRFWMVDYLADVWLNGVHVGRHEGGEEAFVFDATNAIKPGAANRLAVRVLNPTSQAIEGMALRLVPGRNKIDHATIGNDYNFGGIVDSVELLVTPAVRVEDLFVRPDGKTGEIRVRTNLRNAQRLRPRSRFCSPSLPPRRAKRPTRLCWSGPCRRATRRLRPS